jgi:antitoxin MazE
MRIPIITIGNSQGIRIPKAFLEELSFNKEAELEASGETLVLRPSKAGPREGWEEVFSKTIIEPEEVGYLPTNWNETEWQW